MPKHAKPTLVRVWPDGYGSDSIEALADDWDGRGGFTLPRAVLAAEVIWSRAHRSECVITVLDSAELEWHVEWVTIGSRQYAGRIVIRCTPRIERLRNALTFDEWSRERAGAAS